MAAAAANAVTTMPTVRGCKAMLCVNQQSTASTANVMMLKINCVNYVVKKCQVRCKTVRIVRKGDGNANVNGNIIERMHTCNEN